MRNLIEDVMRKYPILKKNIEKFHGYMKFYRVYSFIQQLAFFYFYQENTNTYEVLNYYSLRDYDTKYNSIILANYEIGDISLINDFFFEFNENTDLIKEDAIYLSEAIKQLLKELATFDVSSIGLRSSYMVRDLIFFVIIKKLIELKLDQETRRKLNSLPKDPEIFRKLFEETILSRISMGDSNLERLLPEHLEENLKALTKFSFFKDLIRNKVCIYTTSSKSPGFITLNLLTDQFIVCYHPKENMSSLVEFLNNLNLETEIKNTFLKSNLISPAFKEIFLKIELLKELEMQKELVLEFFTRNKGLKAGQIEILNKIIQYYETKGLFYYSKRTDLISVINANKIRSFLKRLNAQINTEISEIFATPVKLSKVS
ncbi:MAG TPA: hypothetical protein VMV49_15335 [Candidatus Deferrimicrobium sp.]|nr:hypothetical protein [Candidatus Deferrimicrobium sp.]